MSIRFERKAALLKTEAVYATDPVPTGAANAVLLKRGSFNPLEGEHLPRELLRTGFGSHPGTFVGRHVSFELAVDLAGSGAAGTAPAYGAMLRAAGLAETIAAGVSVTYTPVDTGFESLGAYFNHEDTRHIATGARGNGRLLFQRQRNPELVLNGLGLWQSDTAVAFPALTTAAWRDPLPSTKANTPTFTIDGVPVVASSFELDLGLSVAYRERINQQDVPVRDRRPKIKALIEELPIGTKDFFAMVGGAPVPLQYVHGVGAGHVITIAIGLVQLKQVPRQEEETDTMLNVEGEVTLGSPEFSIAFT